MTLNRRHTSTHAVAWLIGCVSGRTGSAEEATEDEAITDQWAILLPSRCGERSPTDRVPFFFFPGDIDVNGDFLPPIPSPSKESALTKPTRPADMGSYPGRRGCVCVRACYSWENRGMSVTIPLSSKPNRELGCALATATSAAKGSNIKYGRERDRGKAALDYLSAIAVIYLGTCCRSEHPTFASSGPPLTLWDYGLPTEVQGCLTRQHTQSTTQRESEQVVVLQQTATSLQE
ncbi:uncharacterized protein CIMG_09810 [Coccidioides immitis RS]|uniref:Uncharacterized protein n=1 Tax=Coccidioides immitis (strain RS) TaxID=246410 RepID=J3K372_COCIM|nr:uncharacterized protein CIMG_09810 [Coccidioides immitis RS]EAS28606.3 hypothetical protein CIMG_09810 [Coccidioides immitis RS]